MFLDNQITLFVSHQTLAELRDVSSRPKVIAKLGIVSARVDELFEAIELYATLITEVPKRFVYERDPDDSMYINLAIAADAQIIVSRDNDLLELMNLDNPQHDELKGAHAELRVLDPVEFLIQADEQRRL